MGFSLEVSISAAAVFLQGLFSFFSPCVLPVLPLYIGYLSGGAGARGEDGKISYRQTRVIFHTVCFVVGISFAFFVLGLGVTALGTFFGYSQKILVRAGGILVIVFGLYQLGVFGQPGILGKERRLSLPLHKMAMSPWTAFLMGFTFSFAWTPCVGPALASVLLMAASSSSRTTGFLYIGVYTLGFVLPFLAVGMFTTSLLKLLKTHMEVVNYTAKMGGLLLLILGLLMVTGTMNQVSGYFSQLSLPGTESETERNEDEDEFRDAEPTTGEDEPVLEESEDEPAGREDESSSDQIPAPDFELEDQFGQVHRLSDYKGKTVFLNFWATWCPPCRAEMPDIQRLYEEYDTEGEDALIILGVAGPNMGNEKSQEEIASFLEENGYTYPVVMDSSGELFDQYMIYAFPTTFMIDKEGNVFGYASGQLSYDVMKDIIAQTMEGKRRQ